jgi:hypothetical protein
MSTLRQITNPISKHSLHNYIMHPWTMFGPAVNGQPIENMHLRIRDSQTGKHIATANIKDLQSDPIKHLGFDFSSIQTRQQSGLFHDPSDGRQFRVELHVGRFEDIAPMPAK